MLIGTIGKEKFKKESNFQTYGVLNSNDGTESKCNYNYKPFQTIITNSNINYVQLPINQKWIEGETIMVH